MTYSSHSSENTAITVRRLRVAQAVAILCAAFGGSGAYAETYADCREYGGTRICKLPEQTPWRIGWGSIYYTGSPPPAAQPYCAGVGMDTLATKTPNAAVAQFIQLLSPTLVNECYLDVANVVQYNNCDTASESVLPFDTVVANRPYSPYSGKDVIALPTCDVKQWSIEFPGNYLPMPFPWRDSCQSGTAVQSPAGRILCVAPPDKEEEKDKPDCADAEGNPIDLSNGNKYEAAIDYVDANGNLTLKRYYNSLLNGIGAFGRAWSSEYDSRIEHNRTAVNYGGVESLAIRRGTGATVYLRIDANGAVPLSKYVDFRTTILKSELGLITGYLVNDGEVVEAFNSDGRLISIVRKDGYARSLAYDADDRLTTVTDSFGRKLVFSYISSPSTKGFFVDKVTLPSGRQIQYSYNEFGPYTRITYVTNADGKQRQYLYDSQKRLTGVLDELGVQSSTFGYDSTGAAVSTVRSGGAGEVKTTRVVNGDGSVTIAANVAGVATTRQYTSVAGRLRLAAQSNPAGSGCAAATQTRQYDARGNVAQIDKFGGTRQCFAYDVARNLATVGIDGLSSSQACAALTATGASLPTSALKVTRQWHPDFDVPVRIASPKNISTFVYNGQPDPTNGNQVASCAPGTAMLPDGKPIAVLCKAVEQATTDQDGSLGFAATAEAGTPLRSMSFTYNAVGQLLSQTDGRGNSVGIEYHPSTAAGVTAGDIKKVTPPKGAWASFTAYNLDGHVMNLADANGLATAYVLDPMNRVTQATVGTKSTTFVYDDKGRMKKITGFSGEEANLSYDGADRLVGIADRVGNSITYVLDPAGNAIRTEYKDPTGSIKRWVEASFDALNRMSRLKGVVVPRP